MKKRLISLFLCVAMLFGLLPSVVVFAEDVPAISIYHSGKAVSKMELSEFESETVFANLAQSASGCFQWQIQVSKDTWANISGATGASLTMRYAMLANLLDDHGQVQIRCRFTPNQGEAIVSDPVKVQMVSDYSTTTLEEWVAPDPVAIILDPGSVVVHTPEATAPAETAPVETTAPTAETTQPTEPSQPTEATETTEETADVPAPASETAPEEPTEATTAPMLANLLDMLAVKASAEETNPEVKKTYNIVINYVFENNKTAYESYTANLAEGSKFSATVTFPTVQGYLPYVGENQQNSIELNYESVTENVTINVVYKPTNVKYTVIHYKQNVNDDNYMEAERQTLQGLTGSQVEEVAKDTEKADGGYKGFYSLLYERPNIAADGSTVIEVYYDRYYYLMNFALNGGYGTEPVYARYGADIGTVTEPSLAGYTFGGWSETYVDRGENGTALTIPSTMPTENKTYYAIWIPGNTAKVTVVFWGENADDEGYSYLADSTKVINLKPGREFTYSENEMLVCDKEVHSHTSDCLGCGKTEHTHTAVGGSCYTLTCTAENHTHSTSCYAGVGDKQNVYTGLPDNPQEGQVTDHWRYGNLIYIKGSWYKYTGSTASDSIAPTTCGKTESTHTHTNSCYTLTCITEVHTHSDDCYSCGKEEHTHDSNCYMQGAGLDTTKWKFVKSDTIEVAADGSSVVNVYYDRVEYSVQFYNNKSCSTSGWSSGTQNKEFTDLKITAKWGASIYDKWPTYNNSSSWYLKDKESTWQNGILIMPVGGSQFWGPKSSESNDRTASYYVEVIPGETGDSPEGTGYKFHHSDTSAAKSSTVTDNDHYDIPGFTYDHGTAKGQDYKGAKFYYKRNSYTLTFNDQYNDVKKESVKFEASLSTYKDYVPEVPSAYEPGSVAFGGWYQNPQCTGDEYKLDEHTMPSNDLILYAQWLPVTHTVKFYLTEKSTDPYWPTENTDPLAWNVPHGTNLSPDVVNSLSVDGMNDVKPNGDYTFVMWYYYENGVKKPFDPSTAITKNLTLYGEWSSNTLKEYTVQYVLKSDHSVKVAADLTGSGLAGTTKTFDAKGGTDLYAAYQEGYFPTVQSQSLLLDIESNSLVITFEYVPMPAVPYTVKYVEKDTGKSLADDKVVNDNRKAVVTETFKPISGYMPDAYQKRLVVTAEGQNILYFYYSKDETHAYYKITHYTQNTDGETWTEYASSQAVGDIGTRYTASPMTIPGFTYKEIKYVVKGTEVTDVTTEGAALTTDGLEINLYYVRKEYPYQVRYLEQGTGKVLHDPKDGNGKYGQVISESAIDITDYDKVDPTSATLNIRIDEGEGAPNLNIITFYYKEKEVEIKYEAVGPAAVHFGYVNPESENVKIKSGTAQGSTAYPADGFRFVGWFKDKACTQPADDSWVTDNKIVPQKTDGKNKAATYYAKFEYDVTSLTITKTILGELYDSNEMFIFTIEGEGINQRVAVPANGSVTINGLKVGSTYTITEDGSWSWRYEVVEPDSNSIERKLEQTGNVVVFKNKIKDNKWLTGDSYAKNIFQDGKVTRG